MLCLRKKDNKYIKCIDILMIVVLEFNSDFRIIYYDLLNVE